MKTRSRAGHERDGRRFSERAGRTHAALTLAALVGGALVMTYVTPARANGALPTTIQVLLPPAAPSTIIESTTFGLLISDDEGASWRWTCEHDVSAGAKSYQLGAATSPQLFGLATGGIVRTDDLGCTWSLVMDLSSAFPVDYFPDPTAPDHLLALGILKDGQRTFGVIDLSANGPQGQPGQVLYRAPMGDELTTVEIARSHPQTIYTTIHSPQGMTPARVARSDDAGATWTVVNTQNAPRQMGIVAVDPTDPETIFFRVLADDGDQLAISRDGGKTLAIPLAPKLIMSAFVRLANGHILAGWQSIESGFIYRSVDGGASFTLLPTPIYPRSFNERAGKLYAATDHIRDKYDLAVSTDEGTTWTKVMAFEDVGTTAACLREGPTCWGTCAVLVNQKAFSSAVCPLLGPGDGGADGGNDAAAAGDAGADAGIVDAGDGARTKDAGGCSCRSAAAPVTSSSAGGWGLLVALVLAVAVRVRGRR